jgi:hypothetical protein
MGFNLGFKGLNRERDIIVSLSKVAVVRALWPMKLLFAMDIVSVSL